jgi:hypothetical protein
MEEQRKDFRRTLLRGTNFLLRRVELEMILNER